MKGLLKALGTLAFILYSLSASLMTFYFEYLWAREHGFLSWVFIGSWCSFLKGIVWPLFV